MVGLGHSVSKCSECFINICWDEVHRLGRSLGRLAFPLLGVMSHFSHGVFDCDPISELDCESLQGKEKSQREQALRRKQLEQARCVQFPGGIGKFDDR